MAPALSTPSEYLYHQVVIALSTTLYYLYPVYTREQYLDSGYFYNWDY
jgi:hypothetical protein